MNLKKELSGVAEAVTKVMEAELSLKQKAIAKLAEPKHKIDAGDLAKLRAGHKPVKEDTVDEGYYKDIDTNRKEDERLAAQKKKQVPFTPDKPAKKVATAGKFGYGYSAARHLARKGLASVTKEETEQVEEAVTKTATGYIHHARPGVYGGSEKEKHVVDTLRGPKKSEIEAIEKEKKMKKSFSEMLDLINSQGLKALSEMINEEPDNETFTKELKDQEAKAAGKKKQADIAKGSVQAVKVEEEVEQLDELSPKTLGSYINKANKDVRNISADHEASEYRQARRDDGVSAKEIGDPDAEKDMIDNERRLKTRDVGVKKATNKLIKKAIGENVEQINELSKKTLGSYVKKASKDLGDQSFDHGEDEHRQYGDPEDTERENEMKKRERDIENRQKGINRAVTKLAREYVERVEERSLTEPEMKKKEEIVKSMKKGLAGFKARYGDRAKEVMYATSTKIAKEKA